MVERLFLAMPQGCLQFVIVIFPDHTHLLFVITQMFRVVQPTIQHLVKKCFIVDEPKYTINICVHCFTDYI